MEQALLALDRFADRWDAKYPQISCSWRARWDNPNTACPFGGSGEKHR